MTEEPGEHLSEEPQSARGAPGSRDTGSDEPGTGLGEWSGGTKGFAFTYLNFHFDSAGKFDNTVKVRAKGTFKGSSLSGHATLSTFDANGAQLGSDRSFSFTGKRVKVQAP